MQELGSEVKMELIQYPGFKWQVMDRMSAPLIIQSVVEWLKENFTAASNVFVKADELVLWTVQDILLLYALVLKALPVTQAESLKENVLVGHLKQAYFSAVVAIQSIFTKIRCPHEVNGAQRKAYVIPTTVQLMRQCAVREESLILWRVYPTMLAAQMLMPIRPGTVDRIRQLSNVTMEITRGLVDIGRLIRNVEKKYVALFSPALKNVWLEAVETVKREVQPKGIKLNDPNLWVAAIWYMENSKKFHKLMKEVTTINDLSKKERGGNTAGGSLQLSTPEPQLTQKQMAHFEEELMHSVLAAYATYRRGFMLADTFFEEIRHLMHQPLQIPPPGVITGINSPEIYAHVLWTLPEEIDYVKEGGLPLAEEEEGLEVNDE